MNPLINFFEGFNRWIFRILFYIYCFWFLSCVLPKAVKFLCFSNERQILHQGHEQIQLPRHLISIRYFLGLALVFLLPSVSFAEEIHTVTQMDLKHHFIGYLSIVLTAIAYIIAMTEDVHEMKKSKPMILGSALIWFAICIYYTLNGQAQIAAKAFEVNITAYVELMLFIVVSMTYLNTLAERGIFDGLRIYLLNKQYSYRQLFWIIGALAFFFSTFVSSLTVGLLMGAIVLAVGKNQPKFIALTV